MDSYLDYYPRALIKELLWSKEYHKKAIDEIDKKLAELNMVENKRS